LTKTGKGENGMSNVSTEFKQRVIEKLKALSEKYDMTDIEQGDDEVIATANLGWEKEMGTTPSLRIECQRDLLVLAVRELTYLGSKNSIGNACVYGVTREVTDLLCDKEKEWTRKDRLMHVLMLDAFKNQHKNLWDLMGMVAMSINNMFVATRSIVDYGDGEAWVDTALECDFESIPERFGERFEQLAAHSRFLTDMLYVIRYRIGDESASALEVHKGFSRIQALLKESDKKDKEQVSDLEYAEKTENTDADSSKGNEDSITI